MPPRIITPAQQKRLDTLAHLQREASSPKTKLLDIYNQLRSEGLDGAANQLDRIIGQLEAWQNRRRP